MSSTTDVAPRAGQTTETGLEENVAGALSYLLGFVSGILFLFVEGKNRFVRFHAAQSVVFSVAVIAGYVVLWALELILGGLPIVGFLFRIAFTLAWLAFTLGAFVAWLYLMYRAFRNDAYELPVLGRTARNIAS